MAEATFTFRVDDDLKEAFGEAAKKQDRTSAQLLRDFMRDYVRRQSEVATYDAWFRTRVQEALDDPRPDHSDEEVEVHFARRREAALGGAEGVSKA
jgi:predicted transcriptional regulator